MGFMGGQSRENKPFVVVVLVVVLQTLAHNPISGKETTGGAGRETDFISFAERKSGDRCTRKLRGDSLKRVG